MIRLSKSSLNEKEKQSVMGVLDREYLGMGVEVQKFEKNLSVFFNRPALCVVNGTAALHLALQACGIGSGDEVLVQSLTYIASFQAISATGAKPIACDIVPETITLDLNDAEKRLTSKTKAIMPVHYSGGVGQLNKIYDFAKEHNLRIIEDAAHAFGSSYKGKRVGSFGDIACFSFDGIKNITSGEGGCIVTEDEFILQKVQDARLLGVEKDTEKRYSESRSWDFDVTEQGWRYHMSNIMAAIGIVQLDRFQEIQEKRRNLATHYTYCLKDNSNFSFIDHDYSVVVPHIFPIQIRDPFDRDKLIRAMAEAGVQTGYHYHPNHLLTLYSKKPPHFLPNTETIFPTLLTLPLHEDLSFQDVDFISSTLNHTYGNC